MRRFALALVAAIACLGAFSSVSHARDGEIVTFSAEGVNPDSTPSTQAGGRPYELTNLFTMNQMENPESKQILPAENFKDIKIDLPPGNVGNTQSIPQCLERQFQTLTGCPPETQIGQATVVIQLIYKSTVVAPVYNMKPPRGMPAQFAFIVIAPRVHVNFHVRTGTDYGITATIDSLSTTAPISLSKFTLWGVPADSSHDAQRGVPVSVPRVPLLSNATSCEGPQTTHMQTDTWQRMEGDPLVAPPAESAGMTDCNQVDFSPTIEVKPTTNLADSPTGLEFRLHLPQNKDPDGTAEALLRDSKVELPPGLTVNSASANGLGACTPEQIGFVGLRNERQILRYDSPLTHTFTVSLGGETTAPIQSHASRAEVTKAIETLPGLTGNISLEGAPRGWVVVFDGALEGTDAPELSGQVADNSTQTLEVTGEGGSFNLQSGGVSTGATFESTFTEGATFLQTSNESRPLKAGEPIEGPGIAPGTVATFGFGTFWFLSQPTISDQTGAHLNTALPLNISAEEIELELGKIPSLGAGNVFVTSTGTNGSTRSFEILFARDLAGTSPTITGSSSLTGPGAGVVFTQDPPTPPHPLAVTTETGLRTGTPQFTEAPADCPDSSKIGSVRLDTPLVDHPLSGSVFLATPNRNPFDSFLAMYVAVFDPVTGIVLKLPGLLEADPETGRLTSTISENPQQPFEDLRLEFFKGAAAPLKTGIGCGKYEITTDLTPWTAPEGAIVHPKDSFTISRGAGGGPCVKDEASAPDSPGFEAGTFEPSAGVYSPFSLKLTRPDGAQQLAGIDTTLPRGLLARLAGIPYCPDAALAAAAKKTGLQELADPSCPAASKVGVVTVGAGAGPTPFYVDGSAYLAGPYKGAPLSLAVVTPAVAGPFDVGDVVVRNALYVDPVTTQVRAVSDPIPSILKGIPLSIRSVRVNLDRDQFTRNPTSCNPLEVTGVATTLSGHSTPVSNRFQVGDCGRLGFKPKLALSLKGGTKRLAHPVLKAVLTGREGDANIARVAVSLPKSEFLDNSHIKTICTRVQFAAAQCPAGSVYGQARAFTPLLDAPIEGPVYLRSSSNKLPDLVADLRGQIGVVLAGRIDTTKQGGIRATFEDVPDAPVSKFVLEMFGGSKGLLENSVNLCKHTSKANALLDGHNTKTIDQTPAVATKCNKRARKKRGKANKHGARR